MENFFTADLRRPIETVLPLHKPPARRAEIAQTGGTGQPAKRSHARRDCRKRLRESALPLLFHIWHVNCNREGVHIGQTTLEQGNEIYEYTYRNRHCPSLRDGSRRARPGRGLQTSRSGPRRSAVRLHLLRACRCARAWQESQVPSRS